MRSTLNVEALDEASSLTFIFFSSKTYFRNMMQWVVAPTNPEFTIQAGAAPSLGHRFVHECTQRHNYDDACSLCTIGCANVLYAVSKCGSSLHVMQWPGHRKYYASPVYHNDEFLSATTSLSPTMVQSSWQFLRIQQQIRWVFEAIRMAEVKPPPRAPSKLISPIVKKDPHPKGLYRIRSSAGNHLLTMPVNTNDSEGKIVPYVSQLLVCHCVA
ncbi:hypothetical protein D9613_012833 [Agrocybe pediades]|uniref:Uncharacterized protein n=1 Tax=Agrocybe pediades TaxID=84607 RepID=A0A8H4R1K8_9AGAR|nr:hypothetical protein D9613_012833 [Agrocybe pediades]